MKTLNILIIGFGSAGKRHFQNLLQLGYSNIAVVSRRKNTDAALNNFSFYTTIEEAFKHEIFNAAFICSSTSLHIQNLKELLHYKIEAVYIEKPVSNNYDEVDEVAELASSYKNNIVVGYDLHFDPGILKLKELLQQNIIGEIITVNAMVGQHLSQWRPHEDYRKSVSAKKEMGGGVMLDLIHEVDYLYWLLGKVESVACAYTNSHQLEIETEEAAEILLKFSCGVMATVHLDYWQPVLKRHCFFTGTKGTICLDLAHCKVILTDINGQQEEFNYKYFHRNDRFISALQTFFENPQDERLTGMSEAIESLKIILAAKYSAENNCFIQMEHFRAEA